MSERDAGACSIDGPKKGQFPLAIRQSAQITQGTFQGPNESEKQSHDLSENDVLRFDSAELNAQRVLVWWLEGDDVTLSSADPSSGG